MRKRFQKGQNSEKAFLVRVLMRLISLALKLSTIEKRRQNQICFDEITVTKATTPENDLSPRPVENIFRTSRTKHDRRTAPKPKLFGELQGKSQTPQKTRLGSGPSQMLLYRENK
jgi:hypothetical protein